MILTTVTVVSEAVLLYLLATSREGESGNVFNIKMIIYTLNACSKFPVNVTVCSRAKTPDCCSKAKSQEPRNTSSLRRIIQRRPWATTAKTGTPLDPPVHPYAELWTCITVGSASTSYTRTLGENCLIMIRQTNVALPFREE